MEENNNMNVDNTSKEKGKSFTIIIIILAIVVIGLGSFLAYDKYLKKDTTEEKENSNQTDKNNSSSNNNAENKKEENKEEENKTDDNNNENNTINYNDYKLISDKDKTKYYLVKKDGDNYKEIYTLDYVYPIGFYDNKFYYSKANIEYIDLTKETLSTTKWIEIPQEKCDSNEGYCVQTDVAKSAIINNTLYFSTNSTTGGQIETDGLISISLNATKYEEAKRIDPKTNLDEWYVDETKENIYYAVNSEVYKYNIASDKKEKVLTTNETYMSILYLNNNIIYQNRTNRELKQYNINTKETTTLASNLRVLTTLHEVSKIYKDNLYYFDGTDSIIKTNLKDNKTTYYKIPYVKFFRFITFYDDDIFEVTYDCYMNGPKDPACTKTKEYVSNGKTVDKLPTINVIFSDGSSKQFTIDNIK